jgi:glyoxylase-like metal-dependent hydrolase (beta-lactamase superfamily II)
MLMAYLPKEKILLMTDAFNPPAGPAAPMPVVSPLFVNLYDNLQRLKLDVKQIAPGHGNLSTMTDLLTFIGKGPTKRASAN